MGSSTTAAPSTLSTCPRRGSRAIWNTGPIARKGLHSVGAFPQRSLETITPRAAGDALRYQPLSAMDSPLLVAIGQETTSRVNLVIFLTCENAREIGTMSAWCPNGPLRLQQPDWPRLHY